MKRDDRQGLRVADIAVAQVPPLDIVGMLRVLWFGKWWVAACVALFVLCGGYYAFYMTSAQYRSTAVLQLDAQPAHLGDVSRQWPRPATDAASLNTQLTLLTSDQVLDDVIAQLDLLDDPEFNRYLVAPAPLSSRTLRTKVRQALTGTVQAAPTDAMIRQKTIDNLRGRLTAARPNDTFLFRISAQSHDAEKAARIANAVAAASITAQVGARQRAADEAIAWLSQKVADLRGQLTRQETDITNLIAAVQVQEEAALDTLSTAVLMIDQERATAAAALAVYDQPPAPSSREAAEVAQLQEQITQIDARRARLQAQLATQSAGMAALQQRQRDADTTRVLYQSFLARLQETKVQRGLAYADSQLMTPAVAGAYVGPQKVLMIAIAAVLGAAIGVVLIAIKHLMRRGFDTVHSLQAATGLPVFASLNKRFWRKRPADLHQQMRRIQAGLMLGAKGALPQVILITSSTKGEAATDVAQAFCRSLNVAGRDAICMDTADMGALDHIADTLAQARADHDHIVITAPPVLGNVETQLMATRADAVIVTVRWAKTDQRAVLQALALLQGPSDKPFGLVMTGTQSRKLRRFAAIAGEPAPVLG